jgi:phosphoheptose isomerase
MPGVRIVHVEAGKKTIIAKENLLPLMPDFTKNTLNFIHTQSISYDLIHANFFMSALVAADLKKILGIPFVVTFHALGHIRKLHQRDQDHFPEERLDIEKRIVEEADHIIAECPQDKEDLIHFYAAQEDKITIVPCGFNVNEFFPIDRLLARMVLRLPADENIILQLGRMVPRKGIDNVIRALSKLKRTSIPVRLLVVGGEAEDADNPELRRLQSLAEAEGVADIVTFAGRKNRDILRYYYAASDVFITTPWYEPFGITPLEAMACGTPVIGSNVGGIKYSIEDGKTGYLVDPEDPDALAARIYELLHDTALAEKMKAQAIQRVNALFTWTKVARRMTRLYDRVLQSAYRTHDTLGLTFVEEAFNHAMHTFQKTQKLLSQSIMEAASLLVECFRNGKKVLVCGNGGSAAESQHLTAELVGRFELRERKALPAISLTADTSILTAWSNDIGFDDVFARQVEAYGDKGDVLFCFSTSGESCNLINAMRAASLRQMSCVALTGKGGGKLSLYADVNLVVPSDHTQRIQEIHLHILHTLCSLVEKKLFGNSSRRVAVVNGQTYNHAKITNGRKSIANNGEGSIYR